VRRSLQLALALSPGVTELAVEALPATRRAWAALLMDLGVRPSKGLGQHFLYERGIVQRIIKCAGIRTGDEVLEIGPGLGILTEELLRHGARVTAIELDPRLYRHLRNTLGASNALRLIQADALAVNSGELYPRGQPYKVAANLPYSVATAVVRHLLEQNHPPESLVLMLQKEVAERLAAEPPEMSILSVATRLYAEASIAFAVSPTVFIPPPTVDSAVVLFKTRTQPLIPATDRAKFFRIVNAGFRQKRKMVANSLASELHLPKASVTFWVDASGIDAMARAQTISIEGWLRLLETAPEDLA